MPTRKTSVLLDNVIALIEKNLPKEKSKMVSQFSNLLFSNVSQDDLFQRNDSDLYGAALSLWNSFNDFTGEPVIRVFNPELSTHGWEASHTVVQVVVEDMPFLVDSVRMTLSRFDVSAHLFVNCPLKSIRNSAGAVSELLPSDSNKKGSTAQTLFHIEVDTQTAESVIHAMENELFSVVRDVSSVVSDWSSMQEKMIEVIEELKTHKAALKDYRVEENLEFLEWLSAHNFTLMGYRRYDTTPVKGDHRLVPQMESSLGLMAGSKSKERVLSDLPPAAREAALDKNALVLTKTNSRSKVHRPAYIDYVGVKRFDKDGNTIGEDRFIGLYAANFYNSSLTSIPLLKNKLERVMSDVGFTKGTHSNKALLNILETYPRDEVLQGTEDDLKSAAVGILQMQERGMSRIFVRKDMFGRFYSCIVFVPRERYNTKLRVDTQKILKQYFESDEQVEFTTFFSESVYARTHYIVRVKDSSRDVDVKEIENNLAEAAKSWQDKLNSALLNSFGEGKGKQLARNYVEAFSPAYRERNLPSTAITDISKLESLADEKQLEMLFYKPQEQSDTDVVRLSLYHKNQPIHLSDVLPSIENFGLRVVDETPFEVKTCDGRVNWIMDFTMLYSGHLSMEQARELFQNAFANVWFNQYEDDGFNRLVLGASLTGREVTILRAYAKYMRQIGSSFSQNYIESTFERYPKIAKMLIDAFSHRFNPNEKYTKKVIEKNRQDIFEALDNVANLDDDRIIRRYVEMIDATFRTNFYQKDAKGNEKPYVSFKMQPEFISEMPKPIPKFEIFVYSPRVEGVHLRGGKVARGGLRWSDRREDFRTEVLGLVKAQQVKNTVIVPVGAKGGFVCKQLPETGGREAFLNEGKDCYRTFIRALLDVTDNIVRGEIVHPENVIFHDEDDPYLVVAADKGTATFSDIANAISVEYGHWLGDAFASGGSVGYDHKGMGITARGAWESVKRHFREMGVDCQTTDFTATGVGDMSGDVFGNGMLLSKHTRLIAAFNHLHIFFDPDPDAAASWKERKRLFDDPSLSWADYDSHLISKGGGVFNRSAKSISLSPEMKRWLKTTKSEMNPIELIHNILKMEVDLFWNGGIGTYVKASSESHADVGDRANDQIRVNGKEMKAKIIGEGGNLGCTQLGRVEYAKAGGRINTDAVDNVGGVDCSDTEVNIKILLNGLVEQGEMTVKQRNKLLYDMTDEVAKIVIRDCYRQTQTISTTQAAGASQLKEQIRFIQELEREGKLDRALEFLPTDDELLERQAQNIGFTRPELAVLVAYGKMVLKDDLNIPEITDDPFNVRSLNLPFPEVLQKKYQTQLANHPLRAEIISTQLANDMVNDLGLNFLHRIKEETGSSIADIAKCYNIAKEVFEVDNMTNQIIELDNKVSADIQIDMLTLLRRTVRRAARWFMRYGNPTLPVEKRVEFYNLVMDDLELNLDKYMVKKEFAQLEVGINRYVNAGVPRQLAFMIATLSTRFSALDLAQIVAKDERGSAHVSTVYYHLGARLSLHWFLEQITNQPIANHWQAMARASYREELDWQQRSLTSVVLKSDLKSKDASKMIDNWIGSNSELLRRWEHMLDEFRASKTHEFAKFSVALRELMLLSHNAQGK